MTIHFGTDGWRAVMADTFTFNNLRLVAQAVADAVSAGDWGGGPGVVDGGFDPRLVVVGFDTRFLSDRFAAEVARVLAANGLRVRLTHSDTATPVVSLAVRHAHAAAGVMITASHNAPRYNGLKLKAAYAGSALPEQCRRVEVYLADNEARARGPNLMDYDRAVNEGLITRFNPTPAYAEHIRKLIDFDVIARRPQRLVVDSMYGSGRGVIKGLLTGGGVEVTEIRGEMNPGFGGIHPEPIARYLGATVGAIAAGHGDLAVVTDGDADRIGAVDGRGQFVDPHKIMALALQYLVERRGWRGAVVKTVSTTRMVNRLAAKYGLPCYETPVGFNHIADHMLNEPVLIGGEESGGISILNHIPEGDGLLMGLLLLEIVAAAGAPLAELTAQLLRDFGPAQYARKDLRLAQPVAKSEMTRRLTEGAPASISGRRVAAVEQLDGVKYVLDDDGWLLIRPSGTEPVLRVYAEARDDETVAALLAYGEGVAAQGRAGD
ncbi:MAG: phosphoglucomutase/phosphomannomutase family protein [Anaerolineales bacterium]|nr:phosphoglucomutase/phosphomannomutase family protein [Anaerolineales bacterium]